MSYGVSAALQQAIYQRLQADTTLDGLVGAAIYDAVPSGIITGTYVSIGPEDVVEKSDMTGHGALHEFTVSVVTDAAGFQQAKEVAAAISDSLVDSTLILARGKLVYLNFNRAKARRVQDADVRRIDLTFHARVQDD
ncbi:DUF3168 domain-containing protein [Aliiroseovarius crassostreae]|uniref:DUF3168 domain-containing protein n=1 Tax=Aliiroseovarius crassostreae TaxID=154981 RepID=UPI003C7A90E2